MSRLLSSLPAGALVKDPDSKYYGKTVVFRILEHNHSGDPTGSTTIMADKIIAIKAFDAKEASNSDSNRRSYGNNRCSYSNLLRWLNSDAAAGGWYAAMHSADAAPSSGNVSYNPYDSEAGFLNGFSENMKNALLSVVKRTAKNTVTDGGSYEDVTSKVFLLSETEVGLGNENGVAEGTQYSYFNSNSARIAYPTAEAVSNSNYTNSSLASSKAWYYWLRTPNASNSCNVRIVNSDGTLIYDYAYCGYNGVRPACSIPSSILVSDEADSDGAYTLIFNSAPDITPDSKDYGDRSAAFSIAIQADDSDGDTFDLQIKIDESVKTTAQAIGSITYALNLEAYWPELDKGAHTISVTATDSQGAATTKTYTFNKTNSCADAPEITNAKEGERKDTEFYVEIQAGADPDGDTQVITVQASTDAEFK